MFKKDMSLSLIDIYELCNDQDRLLEKLQSWNLVPKQGEYKCKKCDGFLDLQKVTNRMDGFRWSCNNAYKQYKKSKRAKCNSFYAFRSGTFFEKSRLTMFQMIG
jgi:hypothetical protein